MGSMLKVIIAIITVIAVVVLWTMGVLDTRLARIICGIVVGGIGWIIWTR